MSHLAPPRPLLAALGGLSLILMTYPGPASAQAQAPAPFEAALQAGKTAEAERLLDARLAQEPGDEDARFALGIVRFLGAVERRMQAFHRHGFLAGVPGITMLPVPANANPQPIDAATARALLQGWVDDLARVEATLAPIRGEVKVPFRFGLIRLDFDGDGKSGDGESLFAIYKQFRQDPTVTPDAVREFVIGFDRGDVDWLRGYCHLLSSLAEFALAHDFRDLFDRSGFLLFTGAKPPADFIRPRSAKPDEANAFDFNFALDVVALVHGIRLPVAEPARLKAALGHLEATVALSRSSWASILAEADNDHEWVPNPRQDSVMPGGRITDEMVRTWHESLDEFGAILAGRKLVPFWRGDDPKRGINLRRVFEDPRPFDLVYWVQGTAAAPYLEVGDVTSPATWGRINRIFRGEYVGFALWFN